MRVIVTGGAGYIGSHAVASLVQAGHDALVIDNFSNSTPQAIAGIRTITGQKVAWHELDVRDGSGLRRVFRSFEPEIVMHFAGLKAVGESWHRPVDYHDNNVGGLLSLIGCMRDTGVSRIIFSSSATVYGESASCPVPESSALRPTNPYARSKAMCEMILEDAAGGASPIQSARLRYFNPVGAHHTGCIGEWPSGIPNNLMPYICQVASGRLSTLRVFGDDYPTPDGTGIRDYIHVMDLVRGHIAALEVLASGDRSFAVNLGTGGGCSVRRLIDIFASTNEVPVPFEIAPRREGDAAECFADVSLAKSLLGWESVLSLEDMCRDAWHWERTRVALSEQAGS